MAAKKKQKRRPPKEVTTAVAEQQQDYRRLAEHVRENPLLYVAAAVFVVLCVLLGIVLRLNALTNEREAMTAYASALAEEAPEERLPRLEQAAEQGGEWSAEAVYVAAETAIKAGQYEKAEELFTALREEHAKSEYVPRAVEGLAWLSENNGDYENALAGYQEVGEKWPDSFIARIQPLNIGRVQEELGNTEQAIEAYQNQVTMFPDSNAAAKAEEALDRLREAHPGLFPEEEQPEEMTEAPAEEAPAEEAPAEEPPAEETPAAAVPAEETPVEQAPAEEAPAEEAPAEEAVPEEPPAEETSTEPAPVEEAPVESAPAEEAPVEEVPEEEASTEEAAAAAETQQQ